MFSQRPPTPTAKTDETACSRRSSATTAEPAFSESPLVGTDETDETFVLGPYSRLMHSPETRAQLEQCRTIVADAEVADELRLLARNLIDHLLEMHDARRMRGSVLLLALDSLELVPGMEDCVAKLRATAMRESLG